MLVLAIWTSAFSNSSQILNVLAATVSDSHNLDISAVVPSANPPGGGSGSGTIGTVATVSLSGFSFPNAKLTLLKDGQVATTLIANADGTFQITINGLTFGNYQLSIFAEDPQGVVSNPHTINVAAFSPIPYSFSGIIIPPTINSSALVVKIGTNFNVYGYAAIGSSVGLEIPGVGFLGSAIADSTGFYRITATANGFAGTYSLRARATLGTVSSQFSRPIQVLFTNSDVPDQQVPPTQYAMCVDYNHDQRVNLIDFSILLFWFGKVNPPSTVDCNGDRVIDIKDFSILMYFWTG